MTLIDGIGAWASIKTPVRDTVRSALFLDRDGVIVEDTGFLCRRQDVTLIDGAAATIADFNRAGVAVVVVTNQSGIARGLFDWSAFDEVEDEIAHRLAHAGAHVDAVFACGYHASGDGPLGAPDHHWRKPNPGMLQAAAKKLRLDLTTSWLVGDRATDVEAAWNAGAAGALQVRTGQGSATEITASERFARHTFTVQVGDDITAARLVLDRILKGSQC